jgi:heme/copper-type cytochrome/quinol oxidase subunit 2
VSPFVPFVLAFAILADASPTAPPQADAVEVVAANWTFTPAKIVMHVGTPTTLHVTSTGGVHGIASDELGIARTGIIPDTPLTITVTPKRAGTYRLGCAIVCGPGQEEMQLLVDVQP